MASAQNSADLCLVFWQRNHHGSLAVSGQTIAFVGCGVFVMPKQGVGGEVLTQGIHHLLLARAAVGIADDSAFGSVDGIHGLSV